MPDYDPDAEYFRQLDQQMGKELDAHAEHLQKSLDKGECPKCSTKLPFPRVTIKSILFECSDICGWRAIYPVGFQK